MQVQLPIFILSLLVHAGIFLTSDRNDRRPRFLAGLAILFNTWPAWYAGFVMATSADMVYLWLGMALFRAPYYLPFLSFLVYWRSGKPR